MGECSPFCPDDEAIAAFFEEQPPASRRESVVRHLSDCRYCRGRLGMLSRLEKDDGDHPVSDDFKARAKQIARTQPTLRWQRVPGWAAAAAAILIIGYWIGQSQPPELIPDTAGPGDRELRSIDESALEPELLLPKEGTSVNPSEFEVHWTAVAGSLHYELYVMNDAGELLVHERLDGTRWTAAGPLPLEPGGEYYVRVEAHLEDTTSVSTGHVRFTVLEEE